MAFPTNNCDPRLIVVEESNGSSLTRATIRAFTKQDFEDQGFKEVGMDKIIASTKEARMAGVRENALMDLLLSRHVALKETKASTQGSVIAPFRLMPRETVVNANWFGVQAGAATPGAGSNGIPVSAWRVTVNIGYSTFKSQLKSLERYFLPGNNVQIQRVDASNGNVLRNLQYKVIAAANANSGATELAVVDLEPNYSAAGWAALSSDEKAVYQPTTGTLFLLANSVSDYESYAYQMPAVLDRTLIEYWHQTFRTAHQYNEEYVKALESPLTSDYFKKFRSLPLAKQRKQQAMIDEARLLNTFFYGERINEKQTVEGYTNLPQVVDPANPSFAIELKANTLGIRTQLGECGRNSDKQGAALDLDALFELCYLLKRTRETTSGTVEVIDVMTDRLTASKIRDLMTKFYKQKYGIDSLSANLQAGQKIKFNGMTVLEYNLYDIPDQMVQLAVFTHPFFDDRILAFDTAHKSAGRAIWGIDWSDVFINVLRTNSAKRTTNVADRLYEAVITPVVTHTQLNSKTIEVQVGDPDRHIMIENFSDACPSLTVQGCDLA
jgi:hypothetical protein